MTSRQRCSGSEGGEKGPDRRAAAETSGRTGEHTGHVGDTHALPPRQRPRRLRHAQPPELRSAVGIRDTQPPSCKGEHRELEKNGALLTGARPDTRPSGSKPQNTQPRGAWIIGGVSVSHSRSRAAVSLSRTLARLASCVWGAWPSRGGGLRWGSGGLAGAALARRRAGLAEGWLPPAVAVSISSCW